MNDINIQLINKRLIEIIYFSEVLIPHLKATITEAEMEYNILIYMFNYQFFLEDLIEMKNSFDEQISLEEQLDLSESEKEFEELSIHAIADVSILIKIIKIEMDEIKIKMERENEKNIKNNSSSLLNY